MKTNLIKNYSKEDDEEEKLSIPSDHRKDSLILDE